MKNKGTFAMTFLLSFAAWSVAMGQVFDDPVVPKKTEAPVRLEAVQKPVPKEKPTPVSVPKVQKQEPKTEPKAAVKKEEEKKPMPVTVSNEDSKVKEKEIVKKEKRTTARSKMPWYHAEPEFKEALREQMNRSESYRSAEREAEQGNFEKIAAWDYAQGWRAQAKEADKNTKALVKERDALKKTYQDSLGLASARIDSLEKAAASWKKQYDEKTGFGWFGWLLAFATVALGIAVLLLFRRNNSFSDEKELKLLGQLNDVRFEMKDLLNFVREKMASSVKNGLIPETALPREKTWEATRKSLEGMQFVMKKDDGIPPPKEADPLPLDENHRLTGANAFKEPDSGYDPRTGIQKILGVILLAVTLGKKGEPWNSGAKKEKNEMQKESHFT